jgi:tRNA-Thr(GGU) m(6)t(6)A37 methyltransferase TsaA
MCLCSAAAELHSQPQDHADAREDLIMVIDVIDLSAGFILRPLGMVRSTLTSRADCPKQGFHGAPEAWLEIDPTFIDGLDGLAVGNEILLFTWLHEAIRDLLRVHPRGDPHRAMRGVFATRSPDRPNPIGLHRVEIVEMPEPTRIRVRPLEVVDGTPIIDIKSVMMEIDER